MAVACDWCGNVVPKGASVCQSCGGRPTGDLQAFNVRMLGGEQHRAPVSEGRCARLWYWGMLGLVGTSGLVAYVLKACGVHFNIDVAGGPLLMVFIFPIYVVIDAICCHHRIPAVLRASSLPIAESIIMVPFVNDLYPLLIGIVFASGNALVSISISSLAMMIRRRRARC